MSALVEATDVVRDYGLPASGMLGPREMLRAVDHVSLRITAGRSLGVVGESGSGKSTLARIIMALERPTAGTVRFKGEDLFALPAPELRKRRRGFQMVFQDPYGSLDPRLPVSRIVAEPLDVAEPRLQRAERRRRIVDMLAAVGLGAEAADRYPHEFSGGQRQRIALARALITQPELIVADEPVSALDVSVQAQVLNLMMDLQDTRGVTYLFISHNLAVVEHVADDVVVMYRGKVVEQGPAEPVLSRPAHPYTRALVDAVFSIEETGTEASKATTEDTTATRPGSCVFASRCPKVQARCIEQAPTMAALGGGRAAACHFPEG